MRKNGHPHTLMYHSSDRVEKTEERFFLTPLKGFVTDKLIKYKAKWTEGLYEGMQKRPLKDPASGEQILRPSVFWGHSMDLISEVSTWIRWSSWQTNHFNWIRGWRGTLRSVGVSILPQIGCWS